MSALPEGNANITTTAIYNNSVSSSIITNIGAEANYSYTVVLVLSGSVCVVFLILVFAIGYVMVTRSKCQGSSTKSKQRKDSEGNEVYQNTNIKPNVRMGDCLRTYMHRPLPQLPGKTEPSVDITDGEENDYLKPILPFRYTHENEIRNLPPAPPVFPTYLANLPLGGEGSYMSVLSDDEAQRLPPRSLCEISPDKNSSEIYEEDGYMPPRKFCEISVDKSSSGTEYPRKLKRIKDNEQQKPMRVSPDVTTRRVVEKSQDIPECKSPTAEDVSITDIAEIELEESNGEKDKIFRSTLQIHLSPPTQPRLNPVTTSKATVVVCIHTGY
jgi:hypothetical protein